MRVFSVEITKCSSKCPNYRYNDGGGHCDESEYCTAVMDETYPNKFRELEIWKYKDGFPEWCPLPKKEEKKLCHLKKGYNLCSCLINDTLKEERRQNNLKLFYQD